MRILLSSADFQRWWRGFSVIGRTNVTILFRFWDYAQYGNPLKTTALRADTLFVSENRLLSTDGFMRHADRPRPNVLIIDDEPSVREYLVAALTHCCGRVLAVESLHGTLQAFETGAFDILLTDICMPGATGLDLLALAKQLNWDCTVILMTGHAGMDQVVAGVRLHAADLLVKPFGIDTLQVSIEKSYEKLLAARCRRQERDLLSAGLKQRTELLKITQQLLSDSYRSSLETLVATLEAREYETYAHSFRVRAYAMKLATSIKYSDNDLPRLAYAALLHDVGKVAVSDSILLKPGPLTTEELESLKCHSAVGERIVNRMGFLSGAGKVIRHHHERWDGRGYPDRLAGNDIPLGSRLFALADTVDAMTSDRCYRSALSMNAVRKEIENCSGTQFDPLIAEAFLAIPDQTWRDLRLQADRDAHAVIIPDVNLAKDLVCSSMPTESFPATALQ